MLARFADDARELSTVVCLCERYGKLWVLRRAPLHVGARRLGSNEWIGLMGNV